MKIPLRILSNGKIGKSSRRFTVVDRAVHKARQEIMVQEDVEMFKALDNVDFHYVWKDK